MAIPLRSAQNPAIDWRNLMPEGVPQGTDVQVPYRSPNVPESVPMTGNLSTGGITPMADNSGLYAIYNKKNPYSAEADRYGAMAGKDMGGRLGQLPGIVAAYQAAKAGKAAQDFEEKRSAKADDIIAKKEAWDKIEGDRKEQARQLGIFEKEIGPQVMQAYIQKYAETKDLDVSSAYAAELANKRNKEKGLSSMPNFTKITGWDEGVITMLWDNAEGKPVQGRIDKYGNLGKMNEKNQFIPADKNDMLLSAYQNSQKADAAVDRANRPSGANPSGMQQYYDANGNEVGKSKDRKAMVAAGATHVGGEWYDTGEIDATGKPVFDQRKIPIREAVIPRGGQVSNTQVGGQPPAPQYVKRVETLNTRPNPVPGSPGSGATPQPSAPPAQAQPAIKDTSGREIYRGQDGKWYYR